MKKQDALRLVLIFHHGGAWDCVKAQTWNQLTGDREVTTRVLCDCVREALISADEVSPDD